MKKIGICTSFASYNYGSALQAFATKQIVANLGLEPIIIKPVNVFSQNRDIGISKLMCIFFRSLIHGRLIQEFKKYHSSTNVPISNEKKNKFDLFYRNSLAPRSFTYTKMKKLAKKDDYFAFICGSDQIWNSESLYLNPFYFLTFAPRFKRIAFAPSFGRDYIPKYNLKQLEKRIKKIPYLSCREDSGVKLIRENYDLHAELLMDPTLALPKDEWLKLIPAHSADRKYILTYFLNKPHKHISDFINDFATKHNVEIINISNIRDIGVSAEYVSDCGPIQFLQIISRACVVFTDSFHGTAFSLIFNKPFYVFDRNYTQGSGNQSTRITSLLKTVQLFERFNNFNINSYNVDFSVANSVLEKGRETSLNYLKKCFKNIAKYAK